MWLDVLGWTATAVFSTSYFFKQAGTLRKTQAIAASLWIMYGLGIHAAPVVVANLIVAVAASASSVRLAAKSAVALAAPVKGLNAGG